MPDEPATPQLLPILRGERVWLRAAEKSDFGHPVLVNDAEIAHFLGIKTPIAEEGADEFGTKVAAQQGKTLYSFAICLLGERRSIGNITLRDLDRDNGSAELAISITDKALLGKGYGTDGLNCLLDFAFGEIRLQRVFLHVFDYNARARRSYEKCGFRVEATLRRARFHRGAYHDIHLMGITRDDWRALDRRRSWELAGP